MQSNEDYLSIIEDDNGAVINSLAEHSDDFSWDVLVVDDEKLVHDITKLALRNEKIFGWPIALHHAYSGNEGLKTILGGQRFVVAFIDVVMETEDAGLKLVQEIRKRGYNDIRIILRTGQPGYAPELSVLTEYDINDYRVKTELTKTKLMSVLISAVRSFRQIDTINNARKGLELIINAASDLFQQQNIEKFSEGVLTQISSLLGEHTSGFVSISANSGENDSHLQDYLVLCGTGVFESCGGKNLSEIDDAQMKNHFSMSLTLNKQIITAEDGSLALYITSYKGGNAFIYIKSDYELSNDNISLLKLFGINISTCFNNINLIQNLDAIAFTDIATGFPNFNALKKEISFVIEEKKHSVVLLLIHIDGLGKMLSLFGTKIFNQVANEIYLKLSEYLPLARIITRSARGDFAVLLNEKDFNRKKIEALRFFPLNVNQNELHLATTMASAQLSEDDLNPEDILQRAILTLIIGKAENRGHLTEYNDTIAATLKDRLNIQYHIRESFRNESSPIEVFLQPKFDISTDKVVGAEALSRWKMNGTYVSPDIFIPIIEESGLSMILTEFVLKAISEWQKSRRQSEYPVVPVSVNLSMKDIPQQNFAIELLNQTDNLGLTPEMIEFEITENVIMYNPEQAIIELNQIKSAGYKIACDDFGKGYSSLSYLNRLPIDIIKIDRAFITPLLPENASRSIAATIIAMTASLGLENVAEGIETEEHHKALEVLGCNICQGFLYGKPVHIDSFNSAFCSEK